MVDQVRKRAGTWSGFEGAQLLERPGSVSRRHTIIVAWLDSDHEHHRASTNALKPAAASKRLSVSTVTYAELVAGNRTKESAHELLYARTTPSMRTL